jgi:hypothetical protein
MVKRNQDAAASIYGDPMWRWRRVFRPLSLWERECRARVADRWTLHRQTIKENQQK